MSLIFLIKFKNINQKSVENFDAESLSKDFRKILLKKLDCSNKNEIEMDEKVKKEEIEDEIGVKSEVTAFTTDFDLRTDLTENQVLERFNMRKELYDRECGNYGKTSPITEEDLSFPTSTLKNVFYNDQYKIIMCLPPKCGTTNWQRVLAVLKFNGTVDASHFHQGPSHKDLNLYRVSDRMDGLSQSLGEGLQF